MEHAEGDGHDRRLDVARLGLSNEGADHVVGLVALELVDRDPERLDDLAHLRELVAQVVRHPLASGLVFGVLLVAERGAGEVERNRNVVRLEVLKAPQDDAAEAERAVDQLPFRCRQGWQREVAAVHEPVAVEQYQPLHDAGLRDVRSMAELYRRLLLIPPPRPRCRAVAIVSRSAGRADAARSAPHRGWPRFAV